jgi:hypothetical protein
MSTRVSLGGPSTDVASTPTASRVTPPPARPFKQVMDASATAVVGGAEAAVRRLPGGPVLAAAFRPAPGAVAPGSVASPEGSAGTAQGVGVGDGTGAGGNMDQMLQQNADMNMYYLELQERISAESRAYTTLSNVLKTRHDTVKNAIGNIR